KSGILRHVASEGDTLEIGATLCTIEEGGEPAGSSSSKEVSDAPKEEGQRSTEAKEEQAEQSEESYAAGSPSPAAAKILKEKGIEPKSIKGTGKDGRITKEDVLNASAVPSASAASKEEKDSGPASDSQEKPLVGS